MKPLPLFLALGMSLSPLHAAPTPSASSAPAELDRSHPPKAGPLPEVALPKTVSETLPNGLRLVVLPDHRQPTVTYRLLIRSGALYDGDSPGLADLCANLLNKGTTTLSAEEFASKTDFLGISVEASASDDAIAVMAFGLANYQKEILGFLRDAVLSPAFLAAEIDKEKRTTISELIANNADPSDLAARLRNRLLYGKHPYGAFPTPESVKAIRRDQLVAFHRTQFLPNHAMLAIVGDVDPQKALAEAKAAFDDWEKGEIPEAELTAFPTVKGVTIHLVDRPASVQSNILVAMPGVPRNNSDFPELQVVNSVLGGGFSGRLFSNLRERHGYTYGSYSGFGSRKLGGAFSAVAQVRNEVTAAATKEIFNELRRLRDSLIPETELELQRTYLAGNYLISLENNRRIAERIQEIDLYDLPADYWETYARRLTGVTPQKAEELARQYIDPENLVVVVVGKAQEVREQLEGLGPVTVYDTDLNPVSEKPAEKPAKQ